MTRVVPVDIENLEIALYTHNGEPQCKQAFAQTTRTLLAECICGNQPNDLMISC
jgi:hypothetical protein